MKQLFTLRTNSVRNGCSLSSEHFPIVSEVKTLNCAKQCSQEPISNCLSLLKRRRSLREVDRKFKYARSIGYGDSYLEFLFSHFKVFRQRAKLHDATGAMRTHNGKSRGCCYMIGQGLNLCLHGHVSGLLFCLFVKLYLFSNYNSVDFGSSISCTVLNIEIIDVSVI